MKRLFELSCDIKDCDVTAQFDTDEQAFEAGWRGVRFEGISEKDVRIAHWICSPHAALLPVFKEG
jgi:hypothetical protein